LAYANLLPYSKSSAPTLAQKFGLYPSLEPRPCAKFAGDIVQLFNEIYVLYFWKEKYL